MDVESDSLVGADLRYRILHRAILESLDLSGVNASDADFRGAILSLGTLDEAILDRAVLVDCRAERASLRGASLVDAALLCGGFSGADFAGADLTGANITGAVFAGASLIGATVRCEGIEQADLVNAVYSKDTVWPDTFDPVAAGALMVGELS